MDVRFTRVIGPGDEGTDCEGVARALIRQGSAGVTLAAFTAQTIERRRTWNAQHRDWLMKYERTLGGDFSVDGIYGRGVHEELEPHFDPMAADLMARWKPELPPLIEPRQGFASLHSSLHEPYSMGRRMGLFDLGTYNSKSRLPSSGRLSDHASSRTGATVPSPPAMAFDLGFDPDTGFLHDTARAFFFAMTVWPTVEYVILGDRIWTEEGGVHPYTFGGHGGHVHVSGFR